MIEVEGIFRSPFTEEFKNKSNFGAMVHFIQSYIGSVTSKSGIA